LYQTAHTQSVAILIYSASVWQLL